MAVPSPKILEDLDRFRRLHAETTDPLAARLLQDIIAELEANLSIAKQDEGGKAKKG
ncbi:hypothetical protein [uncultured Bradyrhizobium sp.]|jgi:hypothetical protein|uniref:hypothetical protein n=1 Tax=uncultured Bradyrhizobium sp. TaxID=199684 RepID=UPI0026070619|nr:hypothetical protein [uncultured Bradyrhizobium sp.]